MLDRNDYQIYITTKTNLSKNSIRICLSRTFIFLDWLKNKKKKLNKISLEEFIYELKQKGLNNNSLNSYIFAFRYLKNYMLDRKIYNNFFDGFTSFKKIRPRIIILSQEEIEKLIHANTIERHYDGPKVRELLFTYQTLRMFLAYTGCSFDEAAKLQVKYIDIPNKRVLMQREKTLRSGGAIRHLYFAEPLTSRLKKLIENKSPDDLVFTNMNGNRIWQTNFGEDLRKAAKIAGIKKRVNIHLLRHTYATYLYMATRDIKVVQEVLGHKDIKSTTVYVHMADEVIKEAMYQHPFVRGNIHPKEFINYIESTIRRFKLENDKRFDFLKIKEAIHIFTSKLYEAILPAYR